MAIVLLSGVVDKWVSGVTLWFNSVLARWRSLDPSDFLTVATPVWITHACVKKKNVQGPLNANSKSTNIIWLLKPCKATKTSHSD